MWPKHMHGQGCTQILIWAKAQSKSQNQGPGVDRLVQENRVTSLATIEPAAEDNQMFPNLSTSANTKHEAQDNNQ